MTGIKAYVLLVLALMVGLGCFIYVGVSRSEQPPCGQSCQPADTAGPDNFELRDFPFEKEWI